MNIEVGDLYDGPLIARGAFGVVRLCHSSTLGLCAVKSIPLPSEEEWVATRREARALELAAGPTTVRLLGLQRLEPSTERPVPVGQLVMEYVSGGTLANLAQNWRPGTGRGIPEGLLKRYVRGLVKALAHVHSKGMAHRDLKGANVMLAVESQGVKLADFGSCKLPPSVSDEFDGIDLSPHGGIPAQNRPTTAISVHGVQRGWAQKDGGTGVGGGQNTHRGEVGTIAWMAPEVVTRDRSGSKANSAAQGKSGPAAANSIAFWQAADIWGVGCTVLELLTGKPPWHGEAEESSEVMLCIASQDLRERLPTWISPHTRSFLNACLSPRPHERPTAAALQEHPFLLGEIFSDESLYPGGGVTGGRGGEGCSSKDAQKMGGVMGIVGGGDGGGGVLSPTFPSPKKLGGQERLGVSGLDGKRANERVHPMGGRQGAPYFSPPGSAVNPGNLLHSHMSSIPHHSLAAALRICDTLKSEVRLSCRQVQHWYKGALLLLLPLLFFFFSFLFLQSPFSGGCKQLSITCARFLTPS